MSVPILTLDANVTCSHSGTATPTSTNPKVLIRNQPVVMQSSTHAISGCTLPPPSSGNGPCVTGQWSSGSTKVLVDGQPIALATSQSTCSPPGTPMLVNQCQNQVLAS